VTDNGTGDYTVNFTTAMPDADYSPNITMAPNYSISNAWAPQLFSQSSATEVAPTTSAFRLHFRDTTNTAYDPKYVCIGVFR
jgi:hypothetical protein